MTNRPTARALEKSCWVAGAMFLLLYFGARALADVERESAVAGFSRARAGPQPGGYILDRADPDQSQWSTGRRQGYAELRADADAMAEVPAAVLRIRRLGLEVPVYADTNERNLNRGAGLVAGTAAPDEDGNVGIAAHRDGFFRVLKDIAVGDLVEVDTLSRHRMYRVAELRIVDPTDTSSLRETDGAAVTLVTCYPFFFVGSAPQRFIVRAVAVSRRSSSQGE